MLIFIKRNIWKDLSNEDLKKEYICESLDEKLFEDPDFISEVIVDNINSIIEKNEKIIERYGLDSYKKMDYPAIDHECGFRHSTGRFAVGAFDWSIESDDSFDYSFNIYKCL